MKTTLLEVVTCRRGARMWASREWGSSFIRTESERRDTELWQTAALASRQDSTQFEDALRRLHALERKLTDQVRTFPCDECVQCLLYKGVEEHPVIKSDLSSPGLCVMTGRHRRPRDASQVTASASLLTLTGLYCRSKPTSEN